MNASKFARHAALAGALALPVPAHAFHPLITDDTGSQGAGGNQLEIGTDHGRSGGATARAVGLTYTRGIADNLDLFIGAAYQTSAQSGWGNVGIGAKWRFHEDVASKFSLALKPEVLLPVSRADEADGLGNGKTSYGLTLIASRETGFGELHFNAELARSNLADAAIAERKSFWRLSVAPVWAVADGWKLAFDLGLQANPDRSQNATMGFVEVGVVYCPNDAVDLSLGVIRDLMDGPVETTTATAQATWHF
ncbi:MAG: transporter [Gallionellaceae bacterium]|nr:transporter [Gallionellaceae bacterium]